MVLKQNKEGLKWKKGRTYKYINKWGVEYKEHVAGHVRAWKGEQLSEIYQVSSKINSQKIKKKEIELVIKVY